MIEAFVPDRARATRFSYHLPATRKRVRPIGIERIYTSELDRLERALAGS